MDVPVAFLAINNFVSTALKRRERERKREREEKKESREKRAKERERARAQERSLFVSLTL